jgi:hypothetical protein
MSEVVIKNAGSGDNAKVTTAGRLKVESVNEEITDHACDTGIEQKYNINTGDITLTSANKTSTLYVKYDGTEGDLVVTSLIYNLGSSTNGTGDVLIEVIRNPTAGDIVTNANNVAVGTGASANQNFGSANTLTADIYLGATGESVFTDGAVTVSTRSASNAGRIVISLGAVILPKGSSLGINYTPPSGNTSQKVQFAAACYVKTAAVGGR